MSAIIALLRIVTTLASLAPVRVRYRSNHTYHNVVFAAVHGLQGSLAASQNSALLDAHPSGLATVAGTE
jgi:hypothetical protein